MINTQTINNNKKDAVLYSLNKQKVIVTENSLDKEKWLKMALETDQIFIYNITNLKSTFSYKYNQDVIMKLYLFREYAEAYASENGIEIDIFETYKDDMFCYEASLTIGKKKTI